jgi:hypothetical protein
MRTPPIGQQPASSAHSRPALGLAFIGFALLCGGAIAWGLKQHHWAPKLTVGVGATASLVGLCCVRHLRQRPLNASSVQDRPPVVTSNLLPLITPTNQSVAASNQSVTVPATQPTTAPATQPTTAPATQPTTAPATQPTSVKLSEYVATILGCDSMTLDEVNQLNDIRWHRVATDILNDDAVDGSALYTQMVDRRFADDRTVDGQSFYLQDGNSPGRRCIELAMALSLIKDNPRQREPGHQLLLQRLGAHVAREFEKRSLSPFFARHLFLGHLAELCERDGKVPPGAKELWQWFPNTFPNKGQEWMTAMQLRDVIRSYQQPASSPSNEFALWRQDAIAPHIVLWALCAGDESASQVAATYLANWSNRPTSRELHQPVIDMIRGNLSLQLPELQQRLAPFRTHWAANVRDEQLRTWLSGQLGS